MLLADQDFLIQSLRLNYIRHVLPNHAAQSSLPGTGPYNLITFDASHSPYLILSGLADETKWPELRSGRSSPPLALGHGRAEGSGTGSARRRGVGGGGLKYSETIVGKAGGGGGAGMRVGGKERSWKGKGLVGLATGVSLGAAVGGDIAASEGEAIGPSDAVNDSTLLGGKQDVPTLPPVVIHSPVPTPIQSPIDTTDTTRPASPVSVASSQGTTEDIRRASTATEDLSGSDSEDDELMLYNDPALDVPEESKIPASFPSSRLSHIPEIPESAVASRINRMSFPPQSPSSLSLSTNLPPASSSPYLGSLISSDDTMGEQSATSSSVSLFGLSRRGPTGSEGAAITRIRSDSGTSLIVPPSKEEVEEVRAALAQQSLRPRERRRVNISARPLVPVPVVEPVPGLQPPTATSSTRKDPRPLPLPPITTSTIPSPITTTTLSTPMVLPSPMTPSRSQHTPLTFPTRSKSPHALPPPPQISALSALLSAKSNSPSASNPFSTLYAALVSRASDALTLSVYFPHSKLPSKKVKLEVKKDLSVEEVIGCALWAYWEDGREPELEVGEEGQETTGWNLRIAEDDGEVDEDFPALDRTRAISAFSFAEFAIVKASPSQKKDNESKQAQIQRRPSRVLAAPKRNLVPIPEAAPMEKSSTMQPPANGLFHPGTMAVSSALAVPVLLRVRVPTVPGQAADYMTVNVANDMYISDVLDYICKKRALDNVKAWALTVQHNNTQIIVPLDRTVDSLGAHTQDLALVKSSETLLLRGNSRGIDLRNTNPSASIFKRLSEPAQSKASELTSTYVRYSVQRKLPMPLGRHSRTIAIDGDYIHLMASDNKGLFDAGRTSSFHISNCKDCKISKRAPASFKIIVQKDRMDKRYDFEAEDSKVAAVIVAHIQGLRAGWKAEQELRNR